MPIDDTTKFIEIITSMEFLRVAAMLLGFIALSIGYGLKLKVVFDVEKINKTYSKIAGGILLVVGLAMFFPGITAEGESKDPFLIYYIVVTVVLVAFWGISSRYTSGSVQLQTLKYSFLVTGVLIGLVVIWRCFSLYFYVTSGAQTEMPFGFKSEASYLPYLILLSSAVLITVWLLYINTSKNENSKNREPIYRYFLILCIYLAVSRLVWEVADQIAKKSLL